MFYGRLISTARSRPFRSFIPHSLLSSDNTTGTRIFFTGIGLWCVSRQDVILNPCNVVEMLFSNVNISSVFFLQRWDVNTRVMDGKVCWEILGKNERSKRTVRELYFGLKILELFFCNSQFVVASISGEEDLQHVVCMVSRSNFYGSN